MQLETHLTSRPKRLHDMMIGDLQDAIRSIDTVIISNTLSAREDACLTATLVQLRAIIRERNSQIDNSGCVSSPD